jgi:hypothetical protein
MGFAQPREGRLQMRKSLLVTSVAVALGLGLVLVAVSEGTSGAAANQQRIDLVTRATAINNFVDVGPAGATPGDIYVFSDDVAFASDPATKVGRADGRCMLIDLSSARFGCTIITSLPNGDITTEGTLINAAGAKSTGAITGGTKDFQKARGEGVLDLGPPEGPHRVTLLVTLLP